MKKIFFLILLLSSANCFSQVFEEVRPTVTMRITGPTSSLEGATETYTIRYSVSGTPAAPLNFVPVITNGSVVSFTPNGVSNGFVLIVHWNCKPVGNGMVRVNETATTSFGEIPVGLTSYANTPTFCTTISPAVQDLPYGMTPDLLSVLCTRFCTDEYQFSYQWQEATIVNGNASAFTNITFATDKVYYPPAYSVQISKLYRRKTSFNILEPTGYVLHEIYSGSAAVNFGPALYPGTISGTEFIYPNTSPVISETPATQGSCTGTGYMYTWEIQTTSFPFWQPLGYEEWFPGFVPTENTRIRRKVNCGVETRYTNELLITISQPFLPGNISISLSSNLPYGTIPIINQTPATGGLCFPANYIYTWERKLDGSGWETIGNSENYPSSIGVVGNMLLRRKISCGGQDLYTNELSITMAPYTSPYTENLNYIRENAIYIPGVHTWAHADNLHTGSKIQSTVYLDAFGRPIQRVVKQGSLKPAVTSDFTNINNYQDLVEIMEYDGLGRKSKSFLPYSTPTSIGFYKANALQEQQLYNQQKYNEPVGSNYAFSTTIYDGSPLNRVLNTKMPGYSWNTNTNYNGISSAYEIVKSAENIRIWNIEFATASIPVDGGAYQDNLLVKNITKDEKNKLIYEYKDLSGNVILKKVQEKEGAELDMNGYGGWLSTYYVYDDFGRLRYTLTPKAVSQMLLSGNWLVTDEVKKGLCFYQEYDEKNRIVIKHSPDGGEVWLVYDNRDRLVLSQDENQRHRNPKPNQWSYSLYDEHDRAISTGLINDVRNLQEMQVFAATLNFQNRDVDLFTGTWETVKAYNPVAGKILQAGVYYCGPCTASFTNSVAYYDKYNDDAKPFVSINSNDFSPSGNAYIEPFTKTQRVNGLTTGTKIRVLDDKYDNLVDSDDKFLASTVYFDDRALVIQTHTENYNSGVDVLSVQYDYSGKTLSTRSIHEMPGSEFDGLLTATTNNYDLLQRPLNILKLYTKNYSAATSLSNYKKLSEIQYDELGRVKTKKIGSDPVSAPNPLEILDYTYNIQGWLTGINKDYAMAGEGASSEFMDQWKRRFGFYIGYENGDQKFEGPQWNGNITGTIWRSQGDNSPRKYNYRYDNIDRFIEAKFTQKESPADGAGSWSTAKVDLSVLMAGYDANGNITGMLQKGIVPGTMGGILLDNMQYQYYDNSNKLKNVADNANTSLSGKQGDFKDYAALNNVDYNYDFNGNLKYDKNKSIIDNTSSVTDNDPNAGIINNFLDLPEQITIKDKSRTEYIYDAGGNKLAKRLVYLAANNTAIKTTWYIGEFIYESIAPAASGTPGTPELQYILNEEGKLRIMEPVAAWSGPSGAVNYLQTTGNVELINNGTVHKWGVWDYYLKDNLTNTRMVITEESHLQQAHCSMEDNPGLIKQEENATFGSNEMDATRFPKPAAWSDNQTLQVAKLLHNPATGTGGTGPSVMLRVMAGDQLFAKTDYFYQQVSPASNNNSIINIIAGGLINIISGSSSIAGGIKDNITAPYLSSSAGPLTPFITSGQPTPNNTTTPRAYLNYIFFDEQFNYVPGNSNGEGSGAAVVQPISSGNTISSSLMGNTKANKNGYVYVYLSNESTNIPVYFDNFDVTHIRGPIVEDNAYYSYGLKINGISSKAALKPLAKEGYQGDYAEQDEESGYNEFVLRTYDPQIGRWIQTDPYDQFSSPYTGIGNNPINNVDPDGGGIEEFALQHFLPAIAGAAIGAAATHGTASDKLRGAAWGFGIGLGASYVATEVNWGKVGDLFQSKTLWMYFDGVKVLEIWNMYKQSQTDKEITGYSNDRYGQPDKTRPIYKNVPKDGENPILTTQLVNGNLHFKDGDNEYNFNVNSGADGNGAIPNGDYTVGEIKNRISPFNVDGSNSGYTVSLTSDPGQGITRTDIRIHPTTKNTHGCIGILGKAQQQQFYKLYPQLLKKYKKIKLKATNVNGSKLKVIADNGTYMGENVIQIKQ